MSAIDRTSPATAAATFALSAALTVAVSMTVAATIATPAAAGIDTIDCREGGLNLAERTICRSQRLQILDAKITEVYADVMLNPRVQDRLKDALRDSQYVFLRRRNACGDDTTCLDEVMGLRVSRIRNYY